MSREDGMRPGLRSSSWFKAAIASMLLVLSCGMAFGQYVEASVQLPDSPVPGQVFFIRVVVNGAEAIRVEAVEPLYVGPVQYIGADVRPFPQAEGPAATVDYHFLALEEGSLIIGSLSVLYDGSPLYVGSWHVAVGVAVGAAVGAAMDGTANGTNDDAGSGIRSGRGGRMASWIVPDAVRVYEPFLARAVLPDGGPVVIPALAVPGAISRPSGDGQGWTVIGTREGELNLPALELDTPGGRVNVAARSLRLRALPQAAAGTKAVGTWSVSLSVDIAGVQVHPGDSGSWEAIAHGDGSAGFAEPPSVKVSDPDGRIVPLLAEPFRFGQALPGKASFTGHAGAIGTFVMDLPGEYLVEVEPYPWFDPGSSQLRYAVTAPVVIHVVAPAALSWMPAEELKTQAVATIRRLAASAGGHWVQALLAIEHEDTEGILLAYEQLAESRSAVMATRLPRPWTGLGLADEGLAALAFIGNDPVTAFHEAARLERWSIMPGMARVFADAAAMAMEIPERPRAVLPPPVALGAAMILAVLLALMLLVGPLHRVSLLRLAGFMMAGLSVLLLVALSLSVVERSEVYFVSVGGSAMAVPSAAASVSFKVRPGSVGKVLRRAPEWVYVEFNDGRNAWLPESEIYSY